MEKIVTLPQRVEDLSGLLIDLKKASFAVKNVGADPYSTYVYLDPEEGKDPLPIAASWVGRQPPAMSDKVAFDQRFKDLKEAIEFQPPEPEPEPEPAPAPAPAVEAPLVEVETPAVEAAEVEAEEPEPAPKPAPKKESKVRGFFRRLLG